MLNAGAFFIVLILSSTHLFLGPILVLQTD